MTFDGFFLVQSVDRYLFSLILFEEVQYPRILMIYQLVSGNRHIDRVYYEIQRKRFERKS